MADCFEQLIEACVHPWTVVNIDVCLRLREALRSTLVDLVICLRDELPACINRLLVVAT